MADGLIKFSGQKLLYELRCSISQQLQQAISFQSNVSGLLIKLLQQFSWPKIVLMDQEIVWILAQDAISLQLLGGEVLCVYCNDCIGLTQDRCGQNRAIVHVGERKYGFNDLLGYIHHCLGKMLSHYVDSTISLVFSILTSYQRFSDLLENLFTPKRSIEGWLFC